MWEQLLGLNPTHNEAAFARGAVLSSLGRLPEAIDALRYSVRLNQYHAESTHNLGVHLMTAAGQQVQELQNLVRDQRDQGAAGSPAAAAAVARMSEEATGSLSKGMEVLARAHALNPLKMNTLE